MKTIGIIVLAGVALLLAAWGLGWIGVASETASAGNVREQYASLYEKHESLKAIAANVCSSQALVAASATDNERIQRQTQAIAQEQNYRRVAAQYDAALLDAFKGKYVGPADLPSSAPELPVCPA